MSDEMALPNQPNLMQCTKDTVKRSVFRSLMWSMLAFGLSIGFIFPLFARIVLNTERAFSPVFLILCITAGLIVGSANFFLFKIVVSREIARVVTGMKHVLHSVAAAENTGEGCNNCQISVTSNDAIGEIQCSFNNMTDAISRRLHMENASRSLHSQLSTSVELNEISKHILMVMASVIESKAGILYGDLGDSYEILTSFGVDLTEQVPQKINLRQGPLNHAMQSGQILPISPRRDGLEWIQLSTPLGQFRPQNITLIPLMTKERAVGLALIASDRDLITAQQFEILETLRSHAAPYLKNSILHRKMKDLAAIDDLTRILNRRFGVLRLKEEFSRSTRHGIPISVMMIDIDHFKNFNDNFGHDAGDEILKMVAKTIENDIRSGDVACRFGGDEFMVIVPGTGQKDAIRLAERLRRNVEATELPYGQQILSGTLSIGIATWPMNSISISDELYNAADKALYFAKNAGKNRIAAIQDDKFIPVSVLTSESDQRAGEG
jgi:two-component system cell cycle response regulator